MKLLSQTFVIPCLLLTWLGLELAAPGDCMGADDVTGKTRPVFVLVDVSGSMVSVPSRGRSSSEVATLKDSIQEMLKETQHLVVDLARGEFDASQHSDWKPDESLLSSPLKEIVGGDASRAPLCGKGDQIVVMPFGDKERPHPLAVSLPLTRFPEDFSAFLGKHFPTSFPDDQTYLTLARATTARVAEAQQIDRYYLFVVTDALQDPEKGTTYSKEEQAILDQLDSPNFVASKIRIGLFKFIGKGLADRGFQVDVWAMDLRLPPSTSSLVLVSPTLTNPLPPGEIDLRWAVQEAGQPAIERPGITSTVTVEDPATGRRIHSENLEDKYAAKIRVDEPGRYRLTIQGASSTESQQGQRGPALGKFQGDLLVGERARLVLLQPDAGTPWQVGREVVLKWAVAKGNAPAEEIPGQRFEVSVAREGDPNGAAGSTVEGYSQAFTPKADGLHKVRVAAVGGNGEAVEALDAQFEAGPFVPEPTPSSIVLKLEPGSGTTENPLQAEDGELALGWDVVGAPAPAGLSFEVSLSDPTSDKRVTSGVFASTTAKVKVPKTGEFLLSIEGKPKTGAAEGVPLPYRRTLAVKVQERPKIRIVLPAANSLADAKPVVFKWSPPSGIKATHYQVKVTGPDPLDQKLTVTTFSKRFTKAGPYSATISVLAPPESVALVKPATVSFQVAPSGTAWWPWLLLGAAIAWAAFWLWRRKQERPKPAVEGGGGWDYPPPSADSTGSPGARDRRRGGVGAESSSSDKPAGRPPRPPIR